MIPLSITLENFLPYKQRVSIDFTGIHVACLAGENGAGKTALLDAITWSLWGRARDGKRSDDELIHHGQTEMSVEFVFLLGQIQHKVIRKRDASKRGQSVLEFQAQDGQTGRWKSIAEAGVRATQQKINDILHMDYETFANSAFIQQGRADAFTVKSAGERKAVLANILGLDQWAEYEQKAKEKINQLREEIRILDRELAAIDSELAHRPTYERELLNTQSHLLQLQNSLHTAEREMADIEQARQALAATNRQIDDLKQRANQSRRDLTEAETELRAEQLKGDPQQVVAEMAVIQQNLEGMERKEQELQRVQAERTHSLAESAQLKGENSVLLSEADPLKNRIATLESSAQALCPTCGQALQAQKRQQLIQDLKIELNTRRQRYQDNASKSKLADDRINQNETRLAQLQNELKQAKPLQKRLAELQAALTTASAAQEKIPTLQARVKRWQMLVVDDEKKLTELASTARTYQLQATEADRRQQALNQMRLEHRVAIEQVGAAQQKIASLAGLEQNRKLKLAERQQFAEQQGMYAELQKAFGKQGVPAMIIEAAVPELEETANDLLGRMSGGRMAVRFDTQRDTKAGDVRETLDIKISDELGTRNYEMYSGGEGFRVNFAIRIALSKLLARRAGAQLQTIIIDEGFGTQDAQGRERLVDAINSIQSDFACVLVVTHIDELKEAFPTRINVDKTPQGSVIHVS
jgi:exonuclease SbcC